MADEPGGLLAEFNSAEELVAAAKRTRKAGYRCIDAFSPYPIEDIGKAIGFETHAIGWLSFSGGLFGFLSALAVQLLTNWNYPINVGGRPIIAFPAFVVVDFELMVLFAVVFPVVGMLALNGLPRLHHPLFSVPEFSRATDDKFFLYVDSSDPKFDSDDTRKFLESLGAASLEPVPS